MFALQQCTAERGGHFTISCTKYVSKPPSRYCGRHHLLCQPPSPRQDFTTAGRTSSFCAELFAIQEALSSVSKFALPAEAPIVVHSNALKAVRLLHFVTGSPVMSQDIRCPTEEIYHEIRAEWILHNLVLPHGKAARPAASFQSPSSLQELDDTTILVARKGHLWCQARAPCAVTFSLAREDVLRRISVKWGWP